MVSELNCHKIITIILPTEPFRVGFHQTMYTVVESAGSVEVCVNLIHPPDDILEERVTVLVFHNESSIYVPPNPTFASKQPFTSIVNTSLHTFQLLILLWAYSIGTI